MREKDQVHDLSIVQMMRPESRNAGRDSAVADMLGYSALTIVIEVGATDLAGTFEVQDSDDGVEFAAVADNALIGGSEANLALAADDDDSVARIGYIGGRRYVRVHMDRSSGAAVMSMIGIRGCPRHAPTPAQHFA